MNLGLKGEHEEITPARHPRTQLCILYANDRGIYAIWSSKEYAVKDLS